ncbi:hypothetical protein PoB_004420200 [Plakobranchus ocellatus]|uniref:Uncharacterized protein n=1 Tax=Plakobranchus ocellatus TaxID=259542 RepID=A0AAV4BES4_9GAST|nr:hypothetical protein PoB_004420200 [Plakobranchus ocellatus]
MADSRPASQKSKIPVRSRSSASITNGSSSGRVCERELRRQSFIPVRQNPAASRQLDHQGTTKDGIAFCRAKLLDQQMRRHGVQVLNGIGLPT